MDPNLGGVWNPSRILGGFAIMLLADRYGDQYNLKMARRIQDEAAPPPPCARRSGARVECQFYRYFRRPIQDDLYATRTGLEGL